MMHKQKVHREEVHNLEKLQQKIIDAFGTITEYMLRIATRSILRRARCYIEQGGGWKFWTSLMFLFFDYEW